MRNCFFTSFTYSYLPRARTLAKSLRYFHPDWAVCAVLVDEAPAGVDDGVIDATFDEVIHPDMLGIPHYHSWLFKHDIVEACTAVKGHTLVRLLEEYDKVVFFDPDIALFSDIGDIAALLDSSSIVLTPHQTEPNSAAAAVRDNEATSLRYGTYNLGFLAIRSDMVGRNFAQWWATQLYRACYDDVQHGIFTDQKYVDLVPALFDRVHIHRDPGCNVASWNLSRRTLRIGRDGSVTVNGRPLRFYHFTKMGAAGETMTERYAVDNVHVHEIWEWYRRELAAQAVDGVPSGYWRFARFSDGLPIPKAARVLYRNTPGLSAAYSDPFDAGHGSYLQWLRDERPDILRHDT